MRFVLRVLINGVAIWLATQLLSGMHVKVAGGGFTGSTVGVLLLVAFVFGLVNAIVKPIVAMLSLPLYVLTLGLFTLVVNALMLMLTAWITSHAAWGLQVDNFGTAVVGALIISIVSWVLSLVVGRRRVH
ncbi:phage holin family protein [Cellulomonas sp. SG140]|uniref:phage holin family protein n=1 Tax=Cellulomonas sp. SG140 TaxID=2976536 RepID=UPI0021E7B4EC|nr:phage holin family protein [Cellulomonas sp. SG140]